MQHVLIAADLSPLCDRAFDRAVQLAGQHGAKLTLLHVIHDQLLRYGAESEGFGADIIKRVEQLLERYAAAVPQGLNGRFERVVKIGLPRSEIIAACDQDGCDLLILGMHHRHPLYDFFTGTTSERIIRNSPIPVLLVANKPNDAYGKVIATTDFSPASSRSLRAALDLAPEASMEVLHVFEAPFPGLMTLREDELDAFRRDLLKRSKEQVRADLATFLNTHAGPSRTRVHPVVERGEIVHVISGEIERTGADLITLGASATGVTGSRLGSKVLAFLNEPPCDVLVSF